MIRSGLVQRNQGYGLYPSFRRKRWGGLDDETPHNASIFNSNSLSTPNSGYQQSIIIAPNSVTRPFQNDLTPKIINPPTFDKTSFYDVFGRIPPPPIENEKKRKYVEDDEME